MAKDVVKYVIVLKNSCRVEMNRNLKGRKPLEFRLEQSVDSVSKTDKYQLEYVLLN